MVVASCVWSQSDLSLDEESWAAQNETARERPSSYQNKESKVHWRQETVRPKEIIETSRIIGALKRKRI